MSTEAVTLSLCTALSLSSVHQEKLQVKVSRQYHAPMKNNFTDNQQKFNPRTTTTLDVLNG